MKTKTLSNKSRPANIKVNYNPELNQYDPQTLFPEKLARANETIKRLGVPKELTEKK